MKSKIKTVSLLLIIGGLFAYLFYLFKIKDEQVRCFIVVNENNIGDLNQGLGLCGSLKNKLPQFKATTFFTHQKSALFRAINEQLLHSKKKVLLLGVGQASIEVLREASKHFQEKLFIVHLSHQLFESPANLSQVSLVGVADVVILPNHALTDAFLDRLKGSKTHLIETVGVLHGLTQEELEGAYNKSKNEIPTSDKYLVVILSGDAPDTKGNILHFTPQEAEKLADFCAEKVRKESHFVLVLNGPRTGSYRDSIKVENAHKEGTLDEVTKTFVARLTSQGLNENDQFKVFNFEFGKQSFYKPALGAVLCNDGLVLVGGESTSMVSETLDCIPRGKVILYFNGAMNPNHFKHCELEYKQGRANVLRNQFQEMLTCSAFLKQPNSIEDQREIIAKRLVEICFQNGLKYL